MAGTCPCVHLRDPRTGRLRCCRYCSWWGAGAGGGCGCRGGVCARTGACGGVGVHVGVCASKHGAGVFHSNVLPHAGGAAAAGWGEPPGDANPSPAALVPFAELIHPLIGAFYLIPEAPTLVDSCRLPAGRCSGAPRHGQHRSRYRINLWLNRRDTAVPGAFPAPGLPFQEAQNSGYPTPCTPQTQEHPSELSISPGEGGGRTERFSFQALGTAWMAESRSRVNISRRVRAGMLPSQDLQLQSLCLKACKYLFIISSTV